LVAVAVTAASVVGLAGPAAADVSIDSEQGQRTGGARIAFRVTNESSTASITKVEVRFPGNVRIPEIYPIAVADWAPSITMTRVDNNPANDVPGSVVWVTMPGREIKPGATSLLPLAMGPMPDTEIVYFDVIQTRSDGSIETWAGVDVPAAGAQHPAFTLKLVPLEPGQVPEDHGHGGAAATDGAQTGAGVDPEAVDPEADDLDSTDGSGTVRLVLVLLLIAALTGLALYWQRRRSARARTRTVPRLPTTRLRRSGLPSSATRARRRRGEWLPQRRHRLRARPRGRDQGQGRAGRRAGPGPAPQGGAHFRAENGRRAAGRRPEIARRRDCHRRARAWKRVETSRQCRRRQRLARGTTLFVLSIRQPVGRVA
jgi:uncharacterized protein YcnI